MNVVARRDLDTTRETPTIELVEVVADLEETDPTALSPLYEQIDDMVAGLFSSPPSGTADAKLEFSYHGYRIHIQQNGTATFLQASG
ncbi:HalOD1 output domain-containing protein [Natronolimnohabitans sp. A-GB9]|uniref:HalOD1 output domain-containing protein n=1 Tax=Natronolimnohabitans sp. A-GB9 TaxID=3069757 RepID=UPI0027B61F69|nr:HalOD1 output domain-containing protein [Natronolimnohabitans sp. A-GB9]MDQ2049425.1 HalOD1 output domain-containing protein [Natronolimnohabitans sp. A-GB9]